MVRARQLLWPLACAAIGLATTASRLASQPPTQPSVTPSPPGEYGPADIAYGARLYDAQCTTCHGANGDGVGGVDLRSGRFRNGTTDQDLTRIVTTGIPGTGMQGFKLDTAELTGIISFLRNMTSFDRGSVKIGDGSRGQALYAREQCARCHRVGAAGARMAPDLSDVGAVRSAASLMRSMTDPTSQMMPINRPVRAVTRDGAVINGRRLNEDTYSVQLIDDHEHLVSLTKSDLREYTIATTSPMPSYKQLSPDDLSNLVAYLLSLKGR